MTKQIDPKYRIEVDTGRHSGDEVEIDIVNASGVPIPGRRTADSVPR
jgi:hypothetical protein